MTIVKNNFPAIIADNESLYYSLLTTVVERSDPLAQISVTHSNKVIIVRISPSHIIYGKHILRDIKDINSTLGLQVQFSKSIKTSGTITYTIEF